MSPERSGADVRTPGNDAAGAAFTPPAVLCSRMFTDDPYGRVVIDRNGEIRFANAVAALMVQRTEAEVIGNNMAEYLHLSDLGRALEVISEMEGEVGEEENDGVPQVFELQRPDGTAIYVEIGSTSYLGDPDVDGLVLRLRPYDGQHHLEQFLKSLSSDASMEDNLAHLVGAVDHTIQQAESAVMHGWDGERFVATVTRALPRLLAGAGAGGPEHESGASEPWPWAQAASTATAVTAAVDDLAEPVRSAALALGFKSCWAFPIPISHDNAMTAVFVVWRRLDGPPRLGHVESMGRAAQAAALAFERRRTEQLLVRAATVDALTGIPNRSQFFRHLEAGVAATGRGRLGVLYLDIDGFKPVNDTHGHRVGDRLLTEVARLLAEHVRPGDFVARLGGDEFAVLCRPVQDLDEVTAVADRLIEVVGRPMVFDGTTVTVGVSIGVAMARLHGETHDAVLDAADGALYRAKREGRGRWRVAAAG